jgi:signal transduction histidine kinase
VPRLVFQEAGCYLSGVNASANHASNRNRVPNASTWVLLAGVLITSLVFWWAWNDAVDSDAKRFQANVEQYREEFETRAEKYQQGLEIMADWISSNETPTLTQWENRMQRTGLQTDYLGMTELAYAPMFNGDSRNRELWQHSYPDHWPPPSEWENGELRVWYQTTQGPAVPPKWGRKLADLITPIGTLRQFFYTTGVRSTRRLMTPAEGSNRQLASFVLLYAAFRNDLPRQLKPGEEYGSHEDLGGYSTDIVTQRLVGSIGILAGTVCMEPFLESIFGARQLEIDVDIYAGPVAETNRMTRLDRPALTRSGSPHYMDFELTWYRDLWHIVAVPNALFFKNSHKIRAWALGLAGVVLTLCFFVTLRIQERARTSAEDWALSLETAREELRQAHKSRVRLERDLHDGVLQSIYASVLGLRRAARWMAAEPARALPIVNDVGNELDAAMTDIRRHLSSRPSEGISPAQLPETVAGLAHAYNRTGQSQVDLDLNSEAIHALNHEQSEQVFQCVREAVSNAHRHGGARNIQIRIQKSDEGVDVLVQDNGTGFNPEGIATPGRGLNHMRQRAELCGGRMELNTRHGGPTMVHIKLPHARTST